MINGNVVMDNDYRHPKASTGIEKKKTSQPFHGEACGVQVKCLTKKGIIQEPVMKRDVGRRDEEIDEVGGSSDKYEQWAKLRSGEEV